MDGSQWALQLRIDELLTGWATTAMPVDRVCGKEGGGHCTLTDTVDCEFVMSCSFVEMIDSLLIDNRQSNRQKYNV